MNNIIFKIYRSILRGILDGKYPAGKMLPAETTLAESFETNRMNAHFAIKKLEKLDLVERKKRVGTKIKDHIDIDKVNQLLLETNRSIYVLYSMTPHWIHWNEASFAALEETIEPECYSITYRNIPTGSGRKEYKALLDEISSAGASALVIFPDMEDSSFLCENADLLLDFEMPIFMLNRSSEPMPMDMVSFVSMDPFGEGAKIGSILKKNHCRNILMLKEVTGKAFWGIKRHEGLKLGLSRGPKKFEANLESVPANEKGFEYTIKKIRELNGNIVIVPANNAFSADFIDFATKHGLKTPDDYKLITFDDNPLYRSYGLTSLAIPMREVGQLFGNMICDKSWLSSYRDRISIKVRPTLIVRDTFKPKII